VEKREKVLWRKMLTMRIANMTHNQKRKSDDKEIKLEPISTKDPVRVLVRQSCLTGTGSSRTVLRGVVL